MREAAGAATVVTPVDMVVTLVGTLEGILTVILAKSTRRHMLSITDSEGDHTAWLALPITILRPDLVTVVIPPASTSRAPIHR